MREPPDLPKREPMPSIAAFPFNLHSLLRGTKASSFVVSNKVYLEALERQFCIEPKKTTMARGEIPQRLSTRSVLLFRKKKPKNVPSMSIKEFMEFKGANELVKFLKEY